MANDNQNQGNALEISAMQSTYDTLRPEQRARVEREVLKIGHSRQLCAIAGVKDYVNLPGDDMVRIYKSAMQRLGYLTSE